MATAGPFNRTGAQGPKGDKGDAGESIVGPRGPKGEKGKDGRDGKDGITKVIHSGSFNVAGDSNTGGGVSPTFMCVDIYDDGTLFLPANVHRLYDSKFVGATIELINLVESA